ncbi:MAG: hypothetical protein HKP50_08910 [Myxococcales bacterium]|nr:hypothetical protein [Myxococcales bacterium]
MISPALSLEVVRICGLGKLCADPKICVLSAILLSMTFQETAAFGYLNGFSATFFGASPDRFALRNLSALD